MKSKLYILAIILLTISSNFVFAQGGGEESDYNSGGTNVPGFIPCPPDQFGREEEECEHPDTNTPGNVPINDYIPSLALAAITIGGITFYRHQKQII